MATRQTEYMQNQIDLLESMLEKQEQDASEIVDSQYIGIFTVTHYCPCQALLWQDRWNYIYRHTSHRIWETKAITLTEEQAADLNKIFEEVKEEGKSEEVNEIEKRRNCKRNQRSKSNS